MSELVEPCVGDLPRPRHRGFDVQGGWPSLVRVRGELDCATAPALAAALEPFVEQGGIVGVDLAALDFVDAAGINAMLDATRGIGERGCVLWHDPPPVVKRLIGIAGLEREIDVEETPR